MYVTDMYVQCYTTSIQWCMLGIVAYAATTRNLDQLLLYETDSDIHNASLCTRSVA
jgi:hypothetical protein